MRLLGRLLVRVLPLEAVYELLQVWLDLLLLRNLHAVVEQHALRGNTACECSLRRLCLERADSRQCRGDREAGLLGACSQLVHVRMGWDQAARLQVVVLVLEDARRELVQPQRDRPPLQVHRLDGHLAGPLRSGACSAAQAQQQQAGTAAGAVVWRLGVRSAAPQRCGCEETSRLRSMLHCPWDTHRDVGKDAGEGQAALLKGHRIVRELHDLGVDQHLLPPVPWPATLVEDHEAHVDAHLGRCQAHAVVPARAALLSTCDGALWPRR